LSQIYKYDYDSRTLKSVSPSTVYRDQLAYAAGLTPTDIINELKMRTFVLEDLDRKGHTTITEVTNFCRAYSRNSREAVASLGYDRDELLKKDKKAGR
jgi:hypothetical protein